MELTKKEKTLRDGFDAFHKVALTNSLDDDAKIKYYAEKLVPYCADCACPVTVEEAMDFVGVQLDLLHELKHKYTTGVITRM